MVTLGQHFDFDFHVEHGWHGVIALCLLFLNYLMVAFPL